MNCFIVAGELSGDTHGANLLSALKNKTPDLNVSGVFGEKITALGYKSLFNIEEFKIMGFIEVLKVYPKALWYFKIVVSYILKNKPDVVILIDYPGFNLRLAAKLRKKGFKGKIVQYICPSIWAWKPNRINTMVKTLDLLLCIKPFEPKYFSTTTLKAIYIGSPVLENVENHIFQTNWKKLFKIPEKRPLIALFPGSRPGEIKKNLPKQLQAAELLKKEFPELIICVSGVQTKYLKIPHEYTYELMKDATLSIAKCGTTITELALLKAPSIVIYQISKINYWIASYLFGLKKLPFYSFPNLLVNKKIFSEIIDFNIEGKKIYEESKNLLTSEKKETFISGCQEVYNALKTKQPCSEMGAELIIDLLKNNHQK